MQTFLLKQRIVLCYGTILPGKGGGHLVLKSGKMASGDCIDIGSGTKTAPQCSQVVNCDTFSDCSCCIVIILPQMFLQLRNRLQNKKLLFVLFPKQYVFQSGGIKFSTTTCIVLLRGHSTYQRAGSYAYTIFVINI